MAAVPVTLSGVLYDLHARTTQRVILLAELSLSDVGVGGGPVYPPDPGVPPGIWGPTDPRPGWGLPGQPPGIWGPTDPRPGYPLPVPPPIIWGPNDPRPTPPIQLPPDTPIPPGTPDDDGFVKPPPASGGWAYHNQYGWGYYPAAGQAGPK